MLHKRARLRIINPAPISRIIAMAISMATKTPWARCRATLIPRPPSCSVVRKPGCAVRRAGARPKRIPEIIEMAAAKTNTRPSKPIASARGRCCGSSPTAACVPQAARIRPRPPPRMESSTLSVSSWRITRLRLAPKAVRIANSRARTVARASRRLATFTQAINNTNPTAANSTSRKGLISPTIESFSGISVTPTPTFVCG